MSDAAHRVDLLIVGATLVTMDAERRIINDGALAVRGDRIAAVGKRREIEPLFSAKEKIEAGRFVVTPGFVNGHIHLTGEQITRGFIPDNLGWEEMVLKWLVPIYTSQTPEEERLSAQFAALEMLRSGTTCFLEAGTIMNLDAVVDGLNETGIRGRVGRWIMDRARGPDENQTALTDKAIRALEDELARYPAKSGARIAAWAELVGHTWNTA
jgi:cytosine/adenosine deaminase-related metal-dependent hydrolase